MNGSSHEERTGPLRSGNLKDACADWEKASSLGDKASSDLVRDKC